VTAYSASTTNNSNTITASGAVGATVEITVNGAPHKSGTAAVWQAGENTVIVTASGAAGERTYTVTVTREGGL